MNAFLCNTRVKCNTTTSIPDVVVLAHYNCDQLLHVLIHLTLTQTLFEYDCVKICNIGDPPPAVL